VKAFIVDCCKSNLRLGDMPDPELWDHDVWVKIYAAGVNPLDSKIRDGECAVAPGTDAVACC
jgi:NADPH:quinone reductase-like Zn-dependent oxidoreductase